MEEAMKLYKQIMEIVNRKSDAEVRKDRDGRLIVYEVKKRKYANQ